jgi:Spondin_N
MRLSYCFVTILLFGACTKEKPEAPTYSEAVYKVTFTGKWTAPQFPVPVNAHFTPIIGMVHSSSAFMFRPGAMATIGVERVAEDGNSFPLLQEIDSLTALKKAASTQIIFTPGLSNESTITIYCNSNYPLFSCMSMLAPTPDWFLGIHDFSLKQGDGWVSDSTVNLFAYDAGTEQGDIFGQDNPPSAPPQTVALLTPANASVLAIGNSSIAPLGTLRFVRQ